MKRILVGAAVMAMFATSCQNEMIVNDVQSTSKGEIFTLEVGKGFESRTVLSGTATHWSEGDQIYVSSIDGKVTGVLTLEGKGGSSNGRFTGFVFGGQPSELKHIVFPVPQGGKIDMSKRDADKLDAPMIGTIGSGAVQTLKNVGGLVAFDTKGEVYSVEAISGTDNMSGGSYTFDPVKGTLTYTPGNNLVPTYVSGDMAYVPVATTTNPTNGTTESTLENVKLNLLVDKQVVASADVTVTSGKIFGDGEEDGYTDVLDIKLVSDEEGLKNAVEVGGYVKLTKSFEVAEGIQIAEGIALTLDLNNCTLDFKEDDGEYGGMTSAGDLTIRNGYINSVNNAVYATGGSLNLIDCHVKTNGGMRANAVEINGKVTAVITGGSYKSEAKLETGQSPDWYGIGIWDGNVTLNTIVGGTFHGGVTLAPGTGQRPEVTITGGSYSGTVFHGLNLNGGDLTLSEDAEFNGEGGDIRIYTGTGTVNGACFDYRTYGDTKYTIETLFKKIEDILMK